MSQASQAAMPIARSSREPIARGRCALDLRGLGWRALAAVVGYVAMLLLHELEIGVSPFPYF